MTGTKKSFLSLGAGLSLKNEANFRQEEHFGRKGLLGLRLQASRDHSALGFLSWSHVHKTLVQVIIKTLGPVTAVNTARSILGMSST